MGEDEICNMSSTELNVRSSIRRQQGNNDEVFNCLFVCLFIENLSSVLMSSSQADRIRATAAFYSHLRHLTAETCIYLFVTKLSHL